MRTTGLSDWAQDSQTSNSLKQALSEVNALLPSEQELLHLSQQVTAQIDINANSSEVDASAGGSSSTGVGTSNVSNIVWIKTIVATVVVGTAIVGLTMSVINNQRKDNIKALYSGVQRTDGTQVHPIPESAVTTNTPSLKSSQTPLFLKKPVSSSAVDVSIQEKSNRHVGKKKNQKKLSPKLSETALLAQARQLEKTNPTKAFALTKRHKRNFPNGLLVQEREVLAIRILLNLGRVQQAKNRKSSFSTAFPTSIHRSAIEGLFDSPPIPAQGIQ